MTTLAVMKARIASELARPNLTAQIANAISTAISVYQKERFRFSETVPLTPVVINTVVGQPYYNYVANPVMRTMQKVDYLLINIGNTVQELQRLEPVDIRLLNFANTQSGQPVSWALEGETIMLYPTPGAVYPLTLGAFFQVPEPANDAEVGNRWMLDGELLIRSRAKFEIATHVTRNAVMADAMSPVPPPPGKATGHATYWAWKDLKGEANRLTSTGRIRAMQF